MSNVNTPPSEETPSSRRLLRSTAIAAVVAAVLLVTAVLPAEYGVDPTGIGRLLGLTQMGEIKVALAKEAAADAATDSAIGGSGDTTASAATPAASGIATGTSLTPSAPDSAMNARVTHITLRPTQGREIKLAMRKGARVNFSWSTDRGVVNYDTHGDPPNPPRGFYHGYGKGQGKPSDEGVLVAAFDGLHGWFWRNRTQDVLTVTLRVNGAYQALREIK